MKLVFASAIAIAISACTPAQDATFKKIEDIVLTDLENGVALAVIEAGIQQYVPAGQDVDVVINDVISFLHDVGAIPPTVLPAALDMQTKVAVKLSAKGSSK
jgi:hypothetical protein